MSEALPPAKYVNCGKLGIPA